MICQQLTTVAVTTLSLFSLCAYLQVVDWIGVFLCTYFIRYLTAFVPIPAYTPNTTHQLHYPPGLKGSRIRYAIANLSVRVCVCVRVGVYVCMFQFGQVFLFLISYEKLKSDYKLYWVREASGVRSYVNKVKGHEEIFYLSYYVIGVQAQVVFVFLGLF